MAERAVFKGYALQGIDGKGRVALPAPMRLIVESSKSDRQIFLTDDRLRGCLRAGDEVWLARLQKRNAEAADRALNAGHDFDYYEVGSTTNGPIDDVPFDASGRFILPPFLRNKGALTDLAFFWGAGDSIEIWDPRRLLAKPDIDPAKRERCEYLMAERGAS